MPRKPGRKPQRGATANPLSFRFPVAVVAELKKAATEQKRSIHWVTCEVLSQWLAYRTKAKKS